MDHYEMVEKLRQKANVSYEEAKAALESTNWDILDALVLLENEGKVHSESSTYTTEEKPVEASKVNNKRDFINTLNRIFFHVKRLINFTCRNELHLTWKDGQNLELTLITVLLLLCLCFPLTVIALVIAFFCGARFSFKGPDVGKVKVTINADGQENKENQENTQN